MGIFLSVLKITGLVLLAIIALLLLIVLLVLFVPIRYRADAVVKETDLEKGPSLILENLTAKASFSWLLHFVRGYIAYPDSKEFTLKVLCFTIYPPKNKKSDDLTLDDEDEYEDDSFEHPKTVYEEALEKEEGFEAKPDEQEKEEETDKDSALEEPKEEELTEEELAKDPIFSEDEFDEEDSGDVRGFFDFLGDIFETIGNIIKIPQNVFRKLQYTISRIYAKINMVKNTLSNDIFKRAFEVTKKQLVRVLRMILPRKFRADFLIGTNDPTVTADILAAYGILYPLLVNKVFLTPDFERQILAGEVHLKGRITVFTIVWAAGVLYFNKDVRKTYRRIRKIIDS